MLTNYDFLGIRFSFLKRSLHQTNRISIISLVINNSRFSSTMKCSYLSILVFTLTGLAALSSCGFASSHDGSHIEKREARPLELKGKILSKRASDVDDDETPKPKKTKKKSAKTTPGPDKGTTLAPTKPSDITTSNKPSISTTSKPSTTTSSKPSTTTSVKPVTTTSAPDDAMEEGKLLMKFESTLQAWEVILTRTKYISRYNKPRALGIFYKINDLVREHWGNNKARGLGGFGGYPGSEKSRRRINRLELLQ